MHDRSRHKHGRSIHGKSEDGVVEDHFGNCSQGLRAFAGEKSSPHRRHEDHQSCEGLDFLGFDVYPMLHDELFRHGGHTYTQALYLDAFRAYSGNFIVPEQTSGLGSQPQFATMTPEPGEMRRMALTSVARGADGLMFFRWRPAHFGAEIYWMGLLDHDDEPRRRYAEAKQFAGDIAAIKDKLLGTSVRVDVGIAGGDYDNQEAYRTYPMGLPSPVEDAAVLHRALYRRNIATGFVHPEDDLSQLKALYVPHWLMWDDVWTQKVRAFAEAGGILIASAMSGTRTRDNHIVRELAPSMGLGSLLGVRVEEFGRIAAGDADGLFQPPSKNMGLGSSAAQPPACSAGRPYHMRYGNVSFRAAHLYEKLILEDDVDPLATWSDRWLEGTAVLTQRKIGKGSGHYLGTYLTDELAERIVDNLFIPAGIVPLLPDMPEGVELTERYVPGGRRLLFVLNTTDASVDIPLPADVPDLLTGSAASGRLSGYDARVLELK